MPLSSPEEYDAAIKKRTAYRGVVTKKVAAVKALSSSEDVTKLLVARKQLVQAAATLDDVTSSIYDQFLTQEDDPEAIEYETDEIEQYRDAVSDAMVFIDSLLGDARSFNESFDSTRGPNARQSKVKQLHCANNADSTSSANVRLPKLSMPTFDGTVTSYTSFKESFYAAVHSRPDISAIEKFAYLRGQLRGGAAKAIEGFSLTSANYSEALEVLDARFGQHDAIVRAHMQSLLTIRLIDGNLEQFTNTIEMHMRSLSALNVSPDSYDVAIFEVVVACLPEELRLLWARHSSRANSLVDFVEFMLAECKHRSAASLRTVKQCKQANHSVNCRQVLPAVSVLASSGDTPSSTSHRDNQAEVPKCYYCEESHYISQCSKFQDLNTAQRYEVAKQKMLCFNCLKSHRIKNCQSKSRCKHCHKKHHTLLHHSTVATKDSTLQSHVSNSSKISCSDKANSTQFSRSVTMPTAKVTVVGGNSSKVVSRVLLDSGSQFTYMRRSLCSQLECETHETIQLNIQTFNERSCGPKSLPVVEVRLQDMSGTSRTMLTIRALVVDRLCLPLPPISLSKDQLLNGIPSIALADEFEECNTRSVDIIIGCDYLNDVLTGNQIRTVAGPILLESVFGWIVQGKLLQDEEPTTRYTPTNFAAAFENKESEQMISQFWSLESMGVRDDETLSAENIAENYSSNQIAQEASGRYVVQFPWKTAYPSVGSNREVAVARLLSLTKRLKANRDWLCEYDKTFRNYLEAGIAERIEATNNNEAVHYLPHHPVLAPGKNTKVRIVFDASCQDENGICLNDLMHSGPCMNPELASVLLRFRLKRIAFTADIEKAFLQIKLDERDSDMVRFLWFDENITDAWPTSPVVEYRMNRLIFGATASPFILAAVMKKHASNYQHLYPSAAKSLSQSMYVDDFIQSSDSLEEACLCQSQAQGLLAKGKMKLRNWCSNSANLIEKIDESLVDRRSNAKVLGVPWDTQRDVIRVHSSIPDKDADISTKRRFLKFAASSFDPLGLCSPFYITAKILLQKIWQEGYSWDDKLPDQLQSQCQSWVNESATATLIEFPRCVSADFEAQSIKLIGFGDASNVAYCAAVYLTSESLTGNVQMKLLIAKTRVAPIKATTLPRLELLSALLLCRLMKYTSESLNLSCTMVYRLDSMVALGWIKGKITKRDVFVQNRVTQIRSMSTPDQWGYIRSDSNPADLGTRGLSIQQFKDELPKWTSPKLHPEESDSLTQDCKREPEPLINKTTVAVASPPPPELLNLSKFSKLSTLLRVTAYCRRFIHNIKYPDIKRTGSLTATELEEARMYWIKSEQARFYATEINALRNGDSIPKQSSIQSLCPFLSEDGTLCVGGRLNRSCLLDSAKNPAILHKGSQLSELLINDAHVRLLHSGATQVVTDLRTKYWIPGLRDSVRKLIRRCLICKRYCTSSYVERFAPLPPERVSGESEAAFSCVGVDHCGPIYVKDANTFNKVYVLLFTCTRFRAVHLELCRSLTVDDFLLAFDRFKARRGIPASVISDNSKTFKAAAERVAIINVGWKFIADRSPWQGGFYERLIQSVKKPLRRVLLNTCVSFEGMRTLLCLVEAVVNSRPLTFVYDDAHEPQPITPSHFVVCKRLTDIPTKLHTDDSQISTEQLRKRAIYQKNLLKAFQNRWKTEYLPELQRNANRVNSTKSVKVGDIVLLKDDGSGRHTWPLGRVDSIVKGTDGRVRTAYVRTKGKILRRGIYNLYPLECSS